MWVFRHLSVFWDSLSEVWACVGRELGNMQREKTELKMVRERQEQDDCICSLFILFYI